MLPRSPAEIRTAIESTARQGPSAISQLAILCLWKVSQRIDPAARYTSPGNYKPLPYLEQVLTNPDENKIKIGSLVSDAIRRYPRPATSSPTQDCSDQEAIKQVRASMEEALAAKHPMRRDYLMVQATINYAKRGFKKAILQPLIEAIVPLEPEPPFNSIPTGLIEALLSVGEYAIISQKVENISIASWYGVTARLDLARLLIAQGHSDAARQVFKNLLAHETEWRPNLLPTGDPEVPTNLIAKLYVYLDEYPSARALMRDKSKAYQLSLESSILINDYLNQRPVNPALVLSLFPEYQPGDRFPKGLAALQCGILEMLLDVGLMDDALKLLRPLFVTLNHVELWGKFEFRTRDAAVVLAPINRPDTIFPFVRDLLIAKSEPQPREDYWWIVHAISGVAPLIMRWSSQQDYQALIDFTRRPNP